MLCTFSSFSKSKRFEDLTEVVQHCNLCGRLCDKLKILSKYNGNIESKVLFIAEAPGRLGANKTGIPLCGDKTGDNFEMLLSNIGWSREDLFITNAILCNPQSDTGNNAKPTKEEIRNCSIYLEMTINLIQPEVIVTLGTVALEALNLISPHNIKLLENVGEKNRWNGKVLVPLYHPGPLAVIHRSIPKQRADFIKLAKIVHPIKGIVNTKKNKPSILAGIKNLNTPFNQCISIIVQSLGEIPYFKLTKLLYFIDLFSLNKLGNSITGELYLRQQEGPWPPKLTEAVKGLDGYEIIFKRNKKDFTVRPGKINRFEITLEDKELEIIKNVIDEYGKMSSTSIKIAAYRSLPMRYILQEEKKGKDMRKVPVLYKNRTAAELTQTDN